MSTRKDDETRVNRNPLVHNIGSLEWDGETRGPSLDEEAPDVTWCERTRRWWKTWQTSPQSMMMLDTDWEAMLETAFLHNLLWGTHMLVDTKGGGGFMDVPCDPKDAKGLASEIRIRLEKMGATIKDRGSMGMRIKVSGSDVVKEAEKAVQGAIDYRKQLGQS